MQMNSQSAADEAALLEIPPIGPVSFPAGLLPYSLN